MPAAAGIPSLPCEATLGACHARCLRLSAAAASKGGGRYPGASIPVLIHACQPAGFPSAAASSGTACAGAWPWVAAASLQTKWGWARRFRRGPASKCTYICMVAQPPMYMLAASPGACLREERRDPYCDDCMFVVLPCMLRPFVSACLAAAQLQSSVACSPARTHSSCRPPSPCISWPPLWRFVAAGADDCRLLRPRGLAAANHHASYNEASVARSR